LIQCDVFVAGKVCVGFVFEVLDELISLLVRKTFLLDESHLEKRKRKIMRNCFIEVDFLIKLFEAAIFE